MSTGTPRKLILSLVATVVLSLGAFGATVAAGWTPKLGLDLAGGLSVVYKPVHKATPVELKEVTNILSNRVNGLGVSGATVNLQGGTVVVAVPGVNDARQILATVGQTAQLLFRPVMCEAYSAKTYKHAWGSKSPQCGSQYLMSRANLGVTPSISAAGFTSNNVSPDPAYTDYASTPPEYDNPKGYVILPDASGSGLRYVLGPAEMTGTAIASSTAQLTQTGQWVVSFKTTGAGSALWDKVAGANFHQLLAIELDGQVQSAPIISASDNVFNSYGGTGSISGNFTETSAKQLALVINFGALPVRLTPEYAQSVSPTLGHSSLLAGLWAGVAGLILVLLYTLIYYRALGAVIVAGLGLTAGVLWAIISALGHTSLAPSFDLAGVTGLIVSIGITVDSYIVYFERLKDEARAGRSVRSSVDRGFRSAWRTVLAADLVSLLAAVLLYMIAVGSVRGFAFFLGLSTLLDILMTWFFTRPLVMVLGRRSSSDSKMSMAAGMGAGGSK